MYTDLMLDIETLGTAPGCVILSVAAVPFYKSDGKIAESHFHMNVDIESCLDAGLKIDPNTLHWWIQKSSLFLELQKDTYELKGVLLSLDRFIKYHCKDDVRVWGKGPSFDSAILRDAYDRFKLSLPWKYSKERCVRTDLCGYEELLKKYLPFDGPEHHPVKDAMHQIKSMTKIRSMITNQQEDGDLFI